MIKNGQHLFGWWCIFFGFSMMVIAGTVGYHTGVFTSELIGFVAGLLFFSLGVRELIWVKRKAKQGGSNG